MKTNALIGLGALAMLSAAVRAATPTYTVTDLGPLITSGFNISYVVGISNDGLVLVSDAGRIRLYWTNGTGWIKDLLLDSRLVKTCDFTKPVNPLGGYPGAISHDGKVVIAATSQDFAGTNQQCIAIFKPDGTSTSAGTWTYNTTLDYQGVVVGVNDSDQVIGELESDLGGFGPKCNFFPAGPPYQILANAINDAGQIAGSSTAGAELCTGGVWKVLPNGKGGANGFALAINDKGEVVGSTATGRGFLYSAGKTVPLGVLPGTTNPGTAPECINIRGQVVGVAATATGSTSFLYQDGAIHDLVTLISPSDPYKQVLSIQLSGNACINDSGLIVTSGSFPGTPAGSELFLLTPQAAK
jgi:probable HAF family extracellular repeat protein